VIQQETGVAARYMRPPYGDYDSEVVRISKQLGQEVIMWTIDTNDWSNVNGAYGAIETELGWGGMNACRGEVQIFSKRPWHGVRVLLVLRLSMWQNMTARNTARMA